MISITLPLPDKTLHPNGRTRSWQKKARLTKKARGEAAMVARQSAPKRPYRAATVQATFHLQRRMDSDNLNAWLKPYLDGMQGIVYGNDNTVTLLPPSQLTGKQADGRKVVLIITEAAP